MIRVDPSSRAATATPTPRRCGGRDRLGTALPRGARADLVPASQPRSAPAARRARRPAGAVAAVVARPHARRHRRRHRRAARRARAASGDTRHAARAAHRGPDRSLGRADRRGPVADEPTQLAEAATALSVPWFLLALAINLLAVLVMTERWRVLLVARGRHEPGFGWLLETTLVSLLLGRCCRPRSAATPSGDRSLARAPARGPSRSRPCWWTRSSAWAPSCCSPRPEPPRAGRLRRHAQCSPSSSAVGLVGALSLAVLFSRPGSALCCGRCGRSPASSRIEAPMRALYDALHAVPRASARARLGLRARAARRSSSCDHVVALRCTEWPLVGFGTLLLLCPVLFLVTIVPVSLNGVGLREATFVVVLASVGGRARGRVRARARVLRRRGADGAARRGGFSCGGRSTAGVTQNLVPSDRSPTL